MKKLAQHHDRTLIDGITIFNFSMKFTVNLINLKQRCKRHSLAKIVLLFTYIPVKSKTTIAMLF